jgi:preprotein translocase subunit SecA
LAWIGLPAQRRLAYAALQINRIRHWEKQFNRLSDTELKQTGLRLRGRARGGESLDRLLPEAFGLACVAAHRTVGMRPFDTQLAAGVVIHHGALAEVATGEGKTLIAAMPAYLNALPGKGVHVTTVNDYLAKRDAEVTGPIFEALGVSVGVLQMQMQDAARIDAYKADITYGMASEFGFDFLRDRLKLAGTQGGATPFWSGWDGRRPEGARPYPRVQRELNFALVDEADSIFIDEGRTPLIISAPTRMATPQEQVIYHWADKLARKLVRGRDFILDDKKNKIELTAAGEQQIRWSSPPCDGAASAMDKLSEQLERSLHAHHRFRRDQHYMVDNGKIIIIDESTGRRMPDRHWREGLHQAVEAKEGVPIHKASDHAAQITFPSYYKLYEKLGCMTGTAAQNWYELRRVYKLWVVPVPTNRAVKRQQWPDQVFPTEEAKFDAVAEEVVRLHRQGRPVLIGTRSVEKSEQLSRRLRAAGIEHQVLNAKFHEQEAEIVKHAGELGRVTIATNMAGRGTDIKLGAGTAKVGGLHVLGTERHETQRVDRQLAGRAGRQGDPGSCQFFLALDDELLEGLGPYQQYYLREIGCEGQQGDWQCFRRLFLKAQRRVEARHRSQRVDLVFYEKHRMDILKDIGADPYVD